MISIDKDVTDTYEMFQSEFEFYVL